jgi:integrase
MPKIRFTVQGIKSLPYPESGRVDYQDSDLPGLILRLTSKGHQSYSVSYWKNGKRPRVTLGDAKLLKLAEAREQARAILRKVNIGIDVAAEKREEERAAAEATTFAKLAHNYVERHAKKKKTPKGAREDELRIDRVLIPRWGARRAGDVRKRDVVALLDEYEDAGTPYARNRMAALLSRIFSFGLDRDIAGLESNPARGLVDLDLEKPRKRVLEDDELKVLLPLFRKEGLAGLGFRMLVLTGQRPAEVFGLRWSEIDGNVWALPKERTKNRHSKHAPDFHIVPLSPQALDVLRELRAWGNRGYVFPSPTRENTPFTNYQKSFRAVRKDAALSQNWRVYDLRATALTGMQELKVAPHVLSAIANHITGGVTMKHYALGGYEDEKREALEAWGQHIEKLDPATMADVVELRRGINR